MKHVDIDHLVLDLKASGTPFALATVVRTVAATAAKAGAKAVIRADGTISEGWIGGGCARAAVLKAARDAIADGRPRLVSVQPKDALGAQGVAAGEERDGIRFATNMCPSQGTMDVFVEPVVPPPELLILGGSPVAVALADLGPRLGYACTIAAPPTDLPPVEGPARRIDSFALDIPAAVGARRYVVVATQGRGDEAALRAALAQPADYIAFVGSHAKGEALRRTLGAEAPPPALAVLKVPAGLDIGALAPEEIALSILAEIVQARRRGARP